MRANFLMLILAVGANLSLSGCDKQASSQKSLAAAKQADAQGNTKAAVIELKNALQKNPDSGEARALLGKMYIRQGDGASAEKEIRKALSLGQNKNALMPELAQALLLQTQFQKVVDEIQVASDATPVEQAKVLIARGNALLLLREADKAAAAFAQAKSLAPDQAEVYAGLANLALARGQEQEASGFIEEAISKDPKRASTWVMKGDWLRLQNKSDAAVAAYEQALKLDPNADKAYGGLATIYIAQNKFDAARVQVTAMAKLDPQLIEPRYLSALIDFRQKKYTAARDALQEILKAAPNNPPSLQLAAATAIALGDYGQGEQQLGVVLQRYPQNTYARKLLASSLIQTRQADKALLTLQPLMRDDQKDTQVWILAGEANLQKKQYTQATTFFERAAQADPKNASVRTELAMSRYASGDTQQALGDLDLASSLASDTGRADMMKVLAYTSKRQWDQALAAVASLEKKQGNSPITYNLKGVVYLGKNQLPEARASFEKAMSLDAAYFPAAMNLAKLDLRDKQTDAARKRFEGVLAKDKDNLQAMLALAGLESELGHEKEMLSWLNKANAAHKDAIQPRTLLARYYLQKKDTAHALSAARETATLFPDNPDALELLGATQLAAGEKDNALATFTKLTALAPDLPGAWLRLGQAQEANKNIEQARSNYLKAIQLKADFGDAELALARLEFAAGRKADALQWVQKMEQQQPKQPLAYMLEGELLQADRQYAKAVAKYEQAYALNKSPDVLIRMNTALTLAGRAPEGETRLLQWIKDNPKDNVIRAYLGDIYLRQGRNQAAAQQYQAVLASFPNDVMALNNLAYAYQQAKDARATQVAEQAFKVAPDSPAVMDTLGWILVNDNQVARGLPLLQAALSKAPDDAEVRYHVAYAWYRSGDSVRAKNELERIIKNGVAFPSEKQAKSLLASLQGGR